MEEVKNLYIVPPLMEGYKIARDADGKWYLWEQDGLEWHDIKGPYRQSQGAKAWLERKRFRDLMAARRRGDDVVWPAISLYDRDNKPL